MPTVSPTQSSDGETIDAADINGPINQLAAVINGNIDSDNLAAGSIDPTVWTNPYSFRVTRGGTSQSGASSGSTTVIEFDTEDYDVGSAWSTSAHEFTVPVDGIYHFSLNVAVDAAGGEARGYVYKTNGGDTVLMQNYTYSDNVTDDLTVQGSFSKQLSAGDTIEARVLHVAGADRTILGSEARTNFQGHLIATT